MSFDREQIGWRGWGWPERAPQLSPSRQRHLLGALSSLLGTACEPRSACASLAQLKLPASRLTSRDVAELAARAGEQAIRSDDAWRARFATGRSLPDLLRLRSGELEHAPDAVVAPEDPAGIARVLEYASRAGIAVVPFGGGTSVVGGVDPVHAPDQRAVIALDTTRLDRVLAVDPQRRTARVQAGITGPALEAELRGRGFCFGHYPQSFELSTLGGWIAARSSGQQSNGYGSIEDRVIAVSVVTPEGELRSLDVPRSAAGPDLKQLVLGSEGTLGVITEAVLRLDPAPTHCDDRGMLFPDFASGASAVREAVQDGAGLYLMRLSDAPETRLGLIQRHDPDRALDAPAWLFRALGRAGYGDASALLLYGAEGSDAGDVRARVERGRAIARRHGGFPLGRSPGRHWRRDRFQAPYLRDWLLDAGVAVDTFESAFAWPSIERAHLGVLAALESAARAHAGGGYAMCHLSHSYSDGACLYFSLLYPLARQDVLGQWREIKRAATDAIVAAGGTLSHHHGVGRDHRDWITQEKGVLGVGALRAVKAQLDPSGIMSPGKLL